MFYQIKKAVQFLENLLSFWKMFDMLVIPVLLVKTSFGPLAPQGGLKYDPCQKWPMFLLYADRAHCVPQTILGKQGKIQKNVRVLKVWVFDPQTHCSNLKITPFLLGGIFFVIFHLVSLVILQIRLPQNIQFLKILKSLVFLGSNYQIIPQLGHQEIVLSLQIPVQIIFFCKNTC